MSVIVLSRPLLDYDVNSQIFYERPTVFELWDLNNEFSNSCQVFDERMQKTLSRRKSSTAGLSQSYKQKKLKPVRAIST